MKRLFVAVALVLAAAFPSHAQVAGGNIYGSVTDESGAPLAGVRVTLVGPDATVHFTTGSQGQFRFLNLGPGSYKLTSALTGFTTVNRENVVIAVGSNVELTMSMKVAAVEETITVTAETPTIDTQKTGTSTNFSQDELSKIPNSRDPWALLRTVPGVVLDRVNVAGNESGQQSAYKGKGSLVSDGVWNLDGMNITDMAAVGSSPTYYDYDAFQEIQVTTGGNDIRQPTGGVGINFVTKRGTNAFHGNAHGFFTAGNGSKDFAWMESSNVPAELAARGVTPATADHNRQIGDYGADLGGPIVKDKLWFWGSYGKQDIRLNRQAGSVIDRTLLIDYHAKLNWQASSKDMVSFLWFNGDKQKFGRAPNNAQVEPDSARYNQADAYPDSGPHGLWKIEDNHVFSPSLFMTGKYAWYSTGFSLSPRGGLNGEAGISSRLGQTFGTTNFSNNVRPQHIANLDGSYFGGNHEVKFGVGFRYTKALSETIWPGDKAVAFDNSATDMRARLYREGRGENTTKYWSAYVGDTFTKNRLTLNVGVRYDRQGGSALPTTVGANGLFPNLVPGLTFAGYDAPFTWSDVSPRVGFAYALDDSRKTLVHISGARYASQLNTGAVGFMNPSSVAGWAEYRWNDLNGDHFVQANEVTITPTPLATGGGFNPLNPTAVTSANRIDANLKAPLTDEIIAGLDRELMPNLSVSVAYTYRRFTRFVWDPRIGITATDYSLTSTVTGTLPNGSAYSVPVYSPNPALVDAGGSGRFETNDPNYHQTFQGVELSVNKRLSNKWMMRLAAAYNDAKEYFDGTPQSILLPNSSQQLSGQITRLDTDPLTGGGQVAPRTGGSGSGDIFLNAKWTINANALYQLPWDLEVAANIFGKQGTPYPLFVNAAAGRDGNIRVLVEPAVDTLRFKDLWDLDLRLAKDVRAGNVSLKITADLFNVFNGNTELNRQRNLLSPAFNQLTSNLSPRILRLGVRFNF